MPARDPEEVFRGFLLGVDPKLLRSRRFMLRIPSSPRCKLCGAPFHGLGGVVLRPLGFGRYPGNPGLCNQCIGSLNRIGLFGVEIPVTLLFADVRSSTSIGERLTPAAFHAFLEGFYRIASEAILEGHGLLDKFVGDEAIGLFFAGVSGPDHVAAGVAAGRRLLDRVASADASADGPIPVGAAVHTGTAYVGSTGTGTAVNDFTALGDVVNTTARLAAVAAAGELLVSVEAAGASGLPVADLERRVVDVRGRAEPVAVVVVRSVPVAGAAS